MGRESLLASDPMPAVHGLRRLFHRHMWVRQRPSTKYAYVEDCLRCGKTRERRFFLVID